MSAPAFADSSTTPYDVIIVGAGAAGLEAARFLLEKGRRVMVLEASDRHGGRIRSHTLGDTRIELGAEEHYLRRNNPVYDAVVSVAGKQAYVPVYVGASLLTLDGKIVSEDSKAAKRDPDVKDYWSYESDRYKLRLIEDRSFNAAEDVFNRYGVDRKHRAWHLYENGIAGSVHGTSLSKLGAASTALQGRGWSLSEEVIGLGPKELGYLDVLDTAWWKPVLKHVRLNAPVAQIDHRETLVSVQETDGTTHLARKVIVTASVGVLQKELIRFLPALPASTITAYQSIGMGQGMKIAIRFRKPFWGNLAYLTHAGLSSNCWCPSNYKVGSQSHILMFYPMGDNAVALNELATRGDGDDGVMRACLSDLDRLYGGAATTNFIDGVVQNWVASPWVLGSYSYPATNTYRTRQENARKDLQVPVDNKIFFAGEATNPNNPSCVPGAIQEGIRTAEEVHTQLPAS